MVRQVAHVEGAAIRLGSGLEGIGHGIDGTVAKGVELDADPFLVKLCSQPVQLGRIDVHSAILVVCSFVGFEQTDPITVDVAIHENLRVIRQDKFGLVLFAVLDLLHPLLKRVRRFQVVDIQRQVVAYAEANPDREWIEGFAWPKGLFPQEIARREWLDEVLPDRNICLMDQGGHAYWCNTLALETTGIMASDFEPPPFAIIERDGDGVPVGTIRETAMGHVKQYVPKASPGPRDCSRKRWHAGNGWTKSCPIAISALWTRVATHTGVILSH